jgi:peptidoglycan hydrolase-like protein with peptidoglycan-binding domain
MGPETQASLAKFQRSQGLEATGRIDEQTRGRLKDTHHS